MELKKQVGGVQESENFFHFSETLFEKHPKKFTLHTPPTSFSGSMCLSVPPFSVPSVPFFQFRQFRFFSSVSSVFSVPSVPAHIVTVNQKKDPKWTQKTNKNGKKMVV